jgi:PPK2 family polyphosphate:nucleotide phosphotransferase
MAKKAEPASSLTDVLRLPAGPVDLRSLDPRATPGFEGGKKEGKQALAGIRKPLDDLQRRLFAHGRSGGSRRVLVVLQGMDTSGKGGVLRHAAALVDPQGLRIKAFGPPTDEEREHDFLWRVGRALPGPGMIGIFDRSHYEDVLIARVHATVSPETVEARYAAINRFEQELVASDTVLVKCLLHISPEKQKERLLARLEDPAKYWKFDPGDVDERRRWGEYRRAYEVALERCTTPQARWLVVPSDRKWYRNWAVAQILRETLDAMGLGWPAPRFDVEEQRRRLLEEGPLR